MLKTVSEVRAAIEKLQEEARNAGTAAVEKRALIAEAAAYSRELAHANSSDTDLDLKRVNRNLQFYLAYLEQEEDPELDRLAGLPLGTFSSHMEEIAAEYEQCGAPTSFGLRVNPRFQLQLQSGNDESIAYSRDRAGQIFRQMDRTWRIAGSSTQFNKAKKAMQTVGELRSPTQMDFFLAGRAVRAYVSKNVKAAYSEVGRTRMACAMAFLKQILDEQSFRRYCYELNSQREVKLLTNGPDGVGYEKTNPRCFVPEEIGTVREVYQLTRDRISALSKTEAAPSARDLAMLTALKTLQAKSPDGESLIVEHEDLQAEIERVQANRSFQELLKRPRDEQLMMALRGNLDTLEGCRNGLSQAQQQELDAARNQRAEEAKRLEELKKQELEAEKRKKAQEEEQRRLDAERPYIEQLFRDQRGPLEEMTSVFAGIFSPLDSNADQESTELVARLVALSEIASAPAKSGGAEKDPTRVDQKLLQARVNVLKDDYIIQYFAKELKEGKYSETVRGLKKQAEQNRMDAELFPVMELGKRLASAYAEGCKQRQTERKQRAAETVEKQQAADGNDGQRQRDRTVAEHYGDRRKKELVNSVAAQPDLGEDRVRFVVAMVQTLREAERRLGLNAPVDANILSERTNLLAEEPEVKAAAQALMKPEIRERLRKALLGQQNSIQALGVFLETLSLERKAEEASPEQHSEPKPGENRDLEKGSTKPEKKRIVKKL
jgi:hypothetical protein